jgi:hypothetical protein
VPPRLLLALPAIGVLAAALLSPTTDPLGTRDQIRLVAGIGGVQIDGGADATRSTEVTIDVPPPTDSSAFIRLSNDGGAMWVIRTWTMSLSWSLVDSAGGVDEDGTKTVVVEGGDGANSWSDLGSASIRLDRTGPLLGTPYFVFFGRVADYVRLDADDSGVGLDRTEISFDHIHWRTLAPRECCFANSFDLREETIGGSWEPGERTIYIRAFDKLGNVTEAPPTLDTVTEMHLDSELPATFKFPLPAVANEPFTIEPVFDAGFTVPSGYHCMWSLSWGDDASRVGTLYNENYGMLTTSVPAEDGVCTPWTLTLPYTPPLEYSWRLFIANDPRATLYVTDLLAGSFRASPGGTSRAVAESNLPLVYMLPDRDFVGEDIAVTYRLYSVGGAELADGLWGCRPSDGSPDSGYSSQIGGTSFSCSVTSSEPYVASWSRVSGTMQWDAVYDPIGDITKPKVSRVRAVPAQSSVLTATSGHARFSWTGSDAGTGIRRYAVQLRRNTGAWRAVDLNNRRATTFDRTVALGVSYRLRVRAVDRAGNIGAWAYSPAFTAGAFDDRATRITWSSGWTRVAAANALSGGLHQTSTAASYGRLRFTGSSVGLMAARGPGSGYTQIYVDGALVATVNLHRATAASPRIVWSKAWSSAASHAVRVKALGTIGRPTVTIDAFAVFK